MRKPKIKLIPVKEARALVEKQRLTINRLENEVESLEGARRNLKRMNDSWLEVTKTAQEAQKLTTVSLTQAIDAQAILKEKTVKLEGILNLYRAETPGQIVKRGIKLFFKARLDAVRNFFARLRFRRAK